MTTGKPLRWGIVSAGRICEDFVNAMSVLEAGTHKVQAVAARNLESAKKFAQTHEIPNAYGDYESLFADKDVDIIYVGTINSGHLSAVLAALDAGKHVLCEKPMGVNAKETRQMIRKAEEKGLFLMEAYWTRFFPAVAKLREILKDNIIGDVRIVSANFGFPLSGNVLEREYGGGGMLSVGCYLPVFSNIALFPDGNVEKPTKIVADGILTEGGVDDTVSFTLHYSNGRVGHFISCASMELANNAFIAGTKGIIKIPANFWNPSTLVTPAGTFDHPLPKTDRKYHFPRSEGLSYEAEHIRQCLVKGLKESPFMPLKESLILAEISDEIRRQIGVIFPQDTK